MRQRLLDQIEWLEVRSAVHRGVRREDPENVTLSGEFAGSIDATILRTSPLIGALPRANRGERIAFREQDRVSDCVPHRIRRKSKRGTTHGSYIK